jgi:hypothetical protein
MFAKAPQAWRDTSMSCDCAKLTNCVNTTDCAISNLFSSDSAKLHKHAAVSRWISMSVDRPATANAFNTPECSHQKEK